MASSFSYYYSHQTFDVFLDVLHDVPEVESRMTNGDLSFGC